MNEDIIKMAREADEYADKHTPLYVTVPNEWQEIRDKRFAALVRADQVEQCVRVCESLDEKDTRYRYDYRRGVQDCIDAMIAHSRAVEMAHGIDDSYRYLITPLKNHE